MAYHHSDFVIGKRRQTFKEAGVKYNLSACHGSGVLHF